MTRIFVCCLLATFLIFSCAQVKNVQAPPAQPTAIPALRILNDTSATAIKISTLSIDIKVVANMATTTFDITFYNPNDRVLEGEFEFPLADGQNIVRYALDIEGRLREGVVVEKAKARVAFESTIREKIDPGLVEKTKGNNFRTRIYPLPAKGSRHILIAIEQPLAQLNKDLYYQLPLFAADPIEHFSINAEVIKHTEKPILGEQSLPGLRFNQKEAGWQGSLSQNNFIANQQVDFRIPYVDANEITTIAENHNNLTYFYVHSRMETPHRSKKMPVSIGILWDISASGEKRNIDKEIELLKNYLANTNYAQVDLIPFNIDVNTEENFEIKSGNCEALLKRISEFRYDGGTQFGTIDLSRYDVDEFILFSDGLSSFGKKDIRFSSAPVTVISSSPVADFAHLKFIAQRSNGQFLDISKTEVPAAIEALQSQSLQVIGVDVDPSAIEDLVMPIRSMETKGFSFAGKLKAPSATITWRLGYGNETISTKTITVTRPANSEYDQVKRIWAGLKVAELELEFEKNKDAITKLGKQFSIVTQNTSLIVLDRIEDYVEHEITPPADLLKEYYTLLQEKKDQERSDKEEALTNAVAMMNELKEWWHTDHSKKKIEEDDNDLTSVIADTATIGSLNFQGNVVTTTDSAMVGHTYFYSNSGTDSTSQFDNMAEVKMEFTPGLVVSNTATKDEASEPVALEVGIELKPWQADMPYLKILEEVEAGKREASYFDLKKQYGSQPSFFIDVARHFYSKNEKKLALRVLSNVAEMKLEDAELMRMIANQLLESNEKELAVETFRELVKIREEDPQSYRDLALALAETGKHDEAVSLLYKVATQSWDGRFGEITSVALNEMNAIISAHKNEVNTSTIDKRLIYAMPLDVRIVIGWSSDNSDIDLWVTDPRKEKCSYEHKETQIGGTISQDVTQGFGPEEFRLKKAVNGKYVVEVNLYGDSRQTTGGPISIKAELFTNFGKPNQKREAINFRVTSNKEVVEIGALNFGS